MDVEARIVLYTVVLGAAIGLAQLIRRRAREFRVYQIELAVLLAVSVAAIGVREWTRPVAWPAFGAFAAVAILPPALLDAARRAARSRRYDLASIGSGAAAVLLGGPAPLRREWGVYGVLGAAERGDAAGCRRRLERLSATVGIPPQLGGDALIRILPAAAERDWPQALREIERSVVTAPLLLAVEVRAAAETGNFARALRACQELDACLPAAATVRWASRRSLLAAAGRLPFLAEAKERRLPVLSGPPGTADLALARAHEARGDAATASAAYAVTLRRARGSVRLDAEDGARRCATGTLLVAGPNELTQGDIAAIESACRTEPPLAGATSALRSAPFTLAASTVTAIASILVFVTLGNDGVSLLAAGALSAPFIRDDGQLWRLGSAVLLHGGWVHLLMNLASILFVGLPLERQIGWARTALVYVTAGLTGSLASAYLAGTPVGVGASGAAMGLIGALLIVLVRRPGRFVPEDRRRWMAALAITVGATFAVGLAESESIDNVAHAAGLAGGALAALLLVPRLRDRPGHVPAMRMAAVAACGLLVVCGLRAAREPLNWRGERVVTAAGVTLELPRWLRMGPGDSHSFTASLPVLGFAVQAGTEPSRPDLDLLVTAESRHAALLDAAPSRVETVSEAGATLDVADYADEDGAGLRVRTFRRGAAFALVVDEMGAGGETEGDEIAFRIGRSLRAVE